MHDEPEDLARPARLPRDLTSRGGGRAPDEATTPGVVDWGASPWLGPATQPADAASAVPGRGARAARGSRAAGRAGRRADTDAGPEGGTREQSGTDGLLEAGPADDGGPERGASRGAARAEGRGGRRGRRRGEPRPELPAPSARRPAEGTVGRRTVSRRPARDLGPDDDPVEVARQVCLDQLSYTARTRAELAAVLDKRGVPGDVAEHVLSRFTDVGLIDDVAFADAWVARRSAGKGLARRALAQELRQRGVDDATAATALETLGQDQELEQARALVERKLGSTAGVEQAARVRRLVGMLARKGYPSGLAYRVVRDALAGEVEGLEDDGLDGLALEE